MDMIDKMYDRYTSGEKKVNEIYHRIAVQLNIPDSEMWTLFCICDTPDKMHTQNFIAEEMGLPKQTINSAINRLLKEDFIYMEKLPLARNNKQILLTEKGKDFCETYIFPLVNAEKKAFSRFGEKEKEIYLSLGIQHNQFRIDELQSLLDGLRGDTV